MKIGIVDDHKLFRKGLISLLVHVLGEIQIVCEADDGFDLQMKISRSEVPDILLLDINMPKVDGFETVVWLQTHYPEVKILVVSMVEKEETIVRMLKLGVKGYLNKDVEPQDLKAALVAIGNGGFFYTDFITGKLIHSIKTDDARNQRTGISKLTDKETVFLSFVCTDMTYSEIAARMFLSPKTIDGYRDSLFQKCHVRSRVGLAIFAIRNGYFQII